MDEIFPCLSEHLNRHVIRDAVLFNQLANKVEIRLRGGRKGNFNLFKPAA